MTIKYYPDLVQGSDEWHAARIGLLTASEMKLIVTPTLKMAANDKERSHLYELLAQRVNGYVEPGYEGYDMVRGKDDEIRARLLYSQKVAAVQEMGFITNDKWGFKVGYSPDGLVGEDGLIEAKSRKAKFQVELIAGLVEKVEAPAEFMLQIQTGLMVSERKWCDFLSYSNGMRMVVIRVYPNPAIQDALCEAAHEFEKRLRSKRSDYNIALSSKVAILAMFETERYVETEMYV